MVTNTWARTQHSRQIQTSLRRLFGHVKLRRGKNLLSTRFIHSGALAAPPNPRSTLWRAAGYQSQTCFPAELLLISVKYLSTWNPAVGVPKLTWGSKGGVPGGVKGHCARQLLVSHRSITCWPLFQILTLLGPHLGSAPRAKVQLGQALFVRVEHFVNLGFPWREGEG